MKSLNAQEILSVAGGLSPNHPNYEGNTPAPSTGGNPNYDDPFAPYVPPPSEAGIPLSQRRDFGNRGS